jgi:hypothetical protein
MRLHGVVLGYLTSYMIRDKIYHNIFPYTSFPKHNANLLISHHTMNVTEKGMNKFGG